MNSSFWCLFIVAQLWLMTTNLHAMHDEQPARAIDTVINYVALLDDEVELIQHLVRSKQSDDGTHPIFEHYDGEKITHTVFYFEKPKSEFARMRDTGGARVDGDERVVFAISAGKILSPGNCSEIKLGEQIYSEMQDDGTTLNKTRMVVVKILSKKANLTVTDELANEKTMLDFLISLHGDYGLRGYYEDNDYRYLFSDYVPDYALNDLLREKLTSDERNNIALATMLAIARLHTVDGILHNDIKSPNLMVDEKNGQWFVRAIDFGQACFIGRECRTICGTNGYRGLELITAVKAPQSILTDLGMLGRVVFGILQSRENNFEDYVIQKNLEAHPHQWDLHPDDFAEAFPDTCGADVVVDNSTLRGRIILFAQKLSLPVLERPTSTDLIKWLEENGVMIDSVSIDPKLILKKAALKDAYYERQKREREERAERRRTQIIDDKPPERAKSKGFPILKKIASTTSRDKSSLSSSDGSTKRSPRRGLLPSLSKSSPHVDNSLLSPKRSFDDGQLTPSTSNSNSPSPSPQNSRPVTPTQSMVLITKNDKHETR